MIRGMLVVNAFLMTEKFIEHYLWLSEAAKRQGMSLEMKTNADFFLPFSNGSDGNDELLAEMFLAYDFIIFWDKDIPLGRRISALIKKFSIPVFNPIGSIALCDDKVATYQRISEWNQKASEEEKISIIPTVMAPMTYSGIGYTDLSFVSKIIDTFGLPLVVKECHGSFGMQVYLARTKEEVCAYTRKLEGIPFLYQKYIAQSAGKDVRLQVVGDRVVAGMYRYSENGDFRANLTNGGSMKPYLASAKEQALAVRTVKALGLSFAGVDLLFSGTKKRCFLEGSSSENHVPVGDETEKDRMCEADIVCEVNSNAHFKNIFTCTGVNTADCIMEHIVERVKKK